MITKKRKSMTQPRSTAYEVIQDDSSEAEKHYKGEDAYYGR